MMAVILILLAFFLLKKVGVSPLDVPSALVGAVDDVASRGLKLTTSTPSTAEIRAGKSVNETPEMLAGSASVLLGIPVSMEAYTIARVIRSERKWGGTNMEAIVIGHIARNVMLASGMVRLIGEDGKYGRQGGSAWFSTSLDPYESDLIFANGILTGVIPDPTNGAKNFVHPGGFASKADYLAVKEKWMAKGLTPIRIEGAPGIEVYT